MSNRFKIKDRYGIEDLLCVFERLRSKDGCAWDREQTHKSIRRDFLEECYEAIEAIDTEDTELLKEELGDVLLQVVFHCEIEKEFGNFTFDDIVNDLCYKLIIRHPHVFSDTKVESTDDILSNWDRIKIETKGQKSNKEALLSTVKALPSLMAYQKYLKKAKKWEMSIPDKKFADIKDNVTEDTVAEALVYVVNLANEKGIDAEEALSKYLKNEINNL